MGAKYYGLLAFLLAIFPASIQAKNLPHPQEWNFVVTLDDKEIGSHTFTLSTGSTKKSWHLASEANFTATIVGIPVYRYHHKTDEDWGDGCLMALTADTDDDGSVSHVEAKNNQLHVTKSKSSAISDTSWKGCLMTFAYWHPDLQKQKHLLNPQTGEIEHVTITQQPSENVIVHGHNVQAQVWRIVGKHEPVDALYAPDGEWVGLNAQTEGGYALAYRLP